MRRAAVTAPLVAVAVAVASTGCAGQATPAPPLSIRLADIQSHTIRLHLHQVMEIGLGSSHAHFTPDVADPQILSVVERRDLTSGRLEPELVPRQLGSTQVALIGSLPYDTVGFRVIVTP